ncbi:PR-1-like protein [Flagelloscypha sp. PMI_526]|nr:PR-1-like protein [Flagelloscypha sp. PMI_526]
MKFQFTTILVTLASTAVIATPVQMTRRQDADVKPMLDLHNKFRAERNAPAMKWSDKAAGKAQEWANKCKFEHSGGTLGPFGENLAAGTGDSYDAAAAFKSWGEDEEGDFDPKNPQPSHFTQVVWKDSTEVGCGMAECDGIFDAKFGKAKYFVCEYSNQGNVIGQFEKNVEKKN